jgi:uncharacterized protein
LITMMTPYLASRPALRITTLALAAALAVMPAAAVAQDATRSATAVVEILNPAARASAQLEAQLKAMRNGDAMRAMLGQNPRFREEAAKNTPAFNAALARMGAIQADALGPIQREMLTAARQAAIQGYAREFTAAELDQIAAFYRSPTGAKLLNRQPAINADVSKAMQQRFGARVQAAEKAVAPRLEAELRKLFPQQAPAK